MKSLETVQKIYKVLSIIVLVAFILMIVGAVGVIFGASVLLTVPLLGSLLTPFFDELGMGTPIQLAISLFAECIVILGQIAVTWLTYRYLKNELADGTPFTYRGAKELLTLGIVSIAVPAATSLVASVIIVIAGTSNSFSNEVDISIGIIMILLSYVFRHGAELAEKVARAEQSESEFKIEF